MGMHVVVVCFALAAVAPPEAGPKAERRRVVTVAGAAALRWPDTPAPRCSVTDGPPGPAGIVRTRCASPELWVSARLAASRTAAITPGLAITSRRRRRSVRARR